MKKLQLALFALFLTGSISAQKTGKITLTQGQKFSLVTNLKTYTSFNMMGQDILNDTRMSGTYDITVDKTAGNTYDIIGQLSKMKMDISMMGQELSYDSENPDSSNPMAAGMENVLNQQQTVTIDQSGKIIKSSFEGEASDVLQQMESAGGGTKAAFMPVSSSLKVGDSFEVSDTDTLTGTKSSLNYKVTSISTNNATLSFNGTVSTKKTMQQQGMDVDVETSGNIEGETVVNIKTGVVQSSKSKTKQTGTLGVMGQELPVTMDIEADVKVTETK